MKDVASVCQECAVRFNYEKGQGVIARINSVDCVRNIELLRTFAICWNCFEKHFSLFATFGDSAIGGPFVSTFVPGKKSHT